MYKKYDFESAAGQQDFERWVTSIIRNEINSVVRQVLFDKSRAAIVVPKNGDPKPGGGNYSTSDITELRLTRLEQTIFGG